MNKTTFIYALMHPITKEIRYIGKANNPKVRLRVHISDGRLFKENTKKSAWICSLLQKELEPELIIIEEVLDSEWKEKECYYIKKYKEEGVPFYKERKAILVENGEWKVENGR